MRSREPLPNEPPLLDPERAIRLVEDARAYLDAPADDVKKLMRLARLTAFDAAPVALETAIDTGDPRVLDAALELATRHVCECDEEHFEYEICSAAHPLFPALKQIDNRVRECARSRSVFLRAYTAKGLGPRALRSLRGESPEDEAELDAEAANIVFALTKDENADVRGAARDALGGAAPPAWATFFPRDPLASMPAAEAARLRGPLDRAAEALEKGVRKDAGPLAEAVGALPDALAAPILDAWMRTPYSSRAKGVEPLLERWITLDPDGARTVAWLRALKDDALELEAGKHLGQVLRRRPREEVLAILLPVVRLLATPGVGPFTMENADGLLEEAWPEDGDRLPLLEAALGAPLADAAALDADEAAQPASRLETLAFAPGQGLEPLIEPMVDALIAGFPGRWTRLAFTIRQCLISVRHPRLRAHAEALVREGDEERLGWAFEHLVKGGHDPALDPPVATMLANASRDPRLRPAIVHNGTLRALALGALRGQLAAGELAPREVIKVATDLIKSDEHALSEAEWEVVRRTRVAIEDPEDRAEAVRALPPYPRWTEEDRAFVEALIDGHGDQLMVAVAITSSLAPKFEPPEHPEVVALLERLQARAPEGERSPVGVVLDRMTRRGR